jgi:hypothetical protein
MKTSTKKKLFIGLACIICIAIVLYKYFNSYLVEGLDNNIYIPTKETSAKIDALVKDNNLSSVFECTINAYKKRPETSGKDFTPSEKKMDALFKYMDPFLRKINIASESLVKIYSDTDIKNNELNVSAFTTQIKELADYHSRVNNFYNENKTILADKTAFHYTCYNQIVNLLNKQNEIYDLLVGPNKGSIISPSISPSPSPSIVPTPTIVPEPVFFKNATYRGMG